MNNYYIERWPDQLTYSVVNTFVNYLYNLSDCTLM